jgi:hypothetical protein
MLKQNAAEFSQTIRGDTSSRQNPFETAIFSLVLYLDPMELKEFPGLMSDMGVIVPSLVLNVELVDPTLDVMVPVREEATEPFI